MKNTEHEKKFKFFRSHLLTIGVRVTVFLEERVGLAAAANGSDDVRASPEKAEPTAHHRPLPFLTLRNSSRRRGRRSSLGKEIPMRGRKENLICYLVKKKIVKLIHSLFSLELTRMPTFTPFYSSQNLVYGLFEETTRNLS